jgi:hypothetical protein
VDNLPELVERLTGDDSRQLVFLIDEVDWLLRHDVEHGSHLFRALRALSEEHQCQFVFSGERTLDRELRNPSSPLFNFCHRVHLGYLDDRNAERLFSEPLGSMNIILREQEALVPLVLWATAGHPYLVQLLGNKIVERLSIEHGNEVGLSDVEQVISEPDFRQGYVDTLWGQAPPLSRALTLFLVAERRPLMTHDFRTCCAHSGVDVREEEIEDALDTLRLHQMICPAGVGHTLLPSGFGRIIEQTKDITLTIDQELREFTRGH